MSVEVSGLKDIWVLQTAFFGDCLLSLPFVSVLLKECPAARIHIVTSKAGTGVFRLACERGLRGDAHRIQIHLFEKRGRHAGFWGMRRFAREVGHPDAVFCLQRSFRSGLLAWLSGAPARIGFSSGAASFFYTLPVRREWVTGRPEIERNLDLLRAFFEREIPAWDPVHAPSLLGRAQPDRDPRVVLSLGSPWPTKRWPIENAVPLIEDLCRRGVEVSLVGDAAAQPLAAELKARVPSLLVKDLTGQTTVEQLADHLATAHLVISGDSAAVHLAGDLNVPVVALFGPTLPEFGFAPWRKGSLALGVGGLYCRPCNIHGPKVCPEGHHRCMKDLSGASVLRHSLRWLPKTD